MLKYSPISGAASEKLIFFVLSEERENMQKRGSDNFKATSAATVSNETSAENCPQKLRRWYGTCEDIISIFIHTNC
jgi:hypothetical protein